jgi:hypothetical protein
VIGFLQPIVLLGLALASIPPLLHLLGRRRPPVVVFPAIQYLTKTEREHSRRLKLRNLLLMLLRMAVIIFVVLAASRPVLRVHGGGDHPPTALAVIFDNSLSSGAVVEGEPVLDRLRVSAQRVVRMTTGDDHLWLMLADGVLQRVTASAASALVDSASSWPVRLDLTAALRTASDALKQAELEAREIVVLSDLQASALSPGDVGSVPVLVLDPPNVPDNIGIDSVVAVPPIWQPDGLVVVSVGGAADRLAALRFAVDGTERARAVARAGDHVPMAAELSQVGWFVATVDLDADELRTDDRRWLAVKVAAPSSVQVGPGAGQFVRQAVAVLSRASSEGGATVSVDDRLRGGTVVLVPPSDPALIGATNRALQSRGVRLSFGDLLEGEWGLTGDVGPIDDISVYRRYRLRGQGVVHVTAGREPWLMRDGDVVVLASRLEESWTALPVSAAFVPFVDFLVNHVAATPTWTVRATPGSTVSLPQVAAAMTSPEGLVALPGDRRVTVPLQLGVRFLLDPSGDTVGALEINHDARETRLAPATAAEIRGSLGADVRTVRASQVERETFGGFRRAELTGILLVAALVAAVAELAVASFGGAARPE